MPSLILLVGVVAPIAGPLFGGDSSSVVKLPEVSVSTWVPVKKVGEYALLEPRFGPAAAVVDGKIYVFGGMNGVDAISNTIECFDPATKSSSIVGRMKRERCFHQVAVVGSKCFIFGGYNGTKLREPMRWMMPFEVEASVEIFDTKDGSLVWGPEMPEPRVMFGCVSDGKKIYVVGGDVRVTTLDSSIKRPVADRFFRLKDRVNVIKEYRSMSATRSMAALDLQSMAWEPMPPMPTYRECSAAWVPGSSIVVLGGYDGHSARREVESFDTRTKTWHVQPILSERVSANSLVYCGSHLLSFGDYDSPGTITAYDLETKTSEKLELRYTPARHGAVVASEGRIFVIGGKRYANSACLAIVQVFDYIPKKKA